MIPWQNLKRFFYKTLKQPFYALRVFKKRMVANIYYFFGNGKSSSPEAVTFFLTHRCNLSCKMCGQWGEGGVTKKASAQYIQEELRPEELRVIINDLSEFRPNITLFGGEPMLYEGIIDIIKHIKKKKMHCLMITNGSLLDKMAKDIVASGLDELNVSLDGDCQLHDGIRGMPGLFDKIINGLKKLQQVKLATHKKKPMVNLQCTISKYNYLYLERLTQVADEVSADSLTFHNLIFFDSKLMERQKQYNEFLGCSSSDWEGFAFEPGIEPQTLYQKIKMIMKEKSRFTVDFYPNFSKRSLIEYYNNPAYVPCEYPARCTSSWIAAYIFPNGEVRPCLNLTYPFGNIKKNRFLETWNSIEAIKFRRLLREKKLFPVCARCTELYRY